MKKIFASLFVLVALIATTTMVHAATNGCCNGGPCCPSEPCCK